MYDIQLLQNLFFLNHCFECLISWPMIITLFFHTQFQVISLCEAFQGRSTCIALCIAYSVPQGTKPSVRKKLPHLSS
jgi:hypothetical protein